MQINAYSQLQSALTAQNKTAPEPKKQAADSAAVPTSTSQDLVELSAEAMSLFNASVDNNEQSSPMSAGGTTLPPIPQGRTTNTDPSDPNYMSAMSAGGTTLPPPPEQAP